MIDQLGFLASTTYDSVNRPKESIDALGRITTSVYDAVGRRLATIDALGNRWTNSYDAVGRPIAQTDPLARISTSVYDVLGRLTASVDPLNGRTSYLYDALNRQLRVLDAVARQTSYAYDAAGRMTQTSSSITQWGQVPNVNTYTYDAMGRQIEMRDTRNQRFTTVYDALGRMQARVNPLGAVATLTYGTNTRTSWLYDAVGRQTATVDAMGRINTNVYDAAGQLSSQQNALGFFTSFAYDAVGRQTSVIDARSHIVTSLFDARGSLLSMQDALGQFTSNSYDAVGNAVLRTDARGIVTTMSYDALDRNIGLAYPVGTLVTYAFDAAGQQTVMGDLTGLTSYSYDLAGRQKSVIYPTGQSLTLTFDPAGRRTLMQEASGARSTYTYTAQYDGPIFLDGPEGLRTRFDYFGGQVQHSGGYISGGVQSLGQAFLFDAPGQVSALLTYHLNVPGFSGLGISYDPAGQVRQTSEAGSTRNYAYDAAGQLTGDQLVNVVPFQLTFSYDPTGNRLTRLDGTARTTYVYDSANQLQTEALGAAVTSYSYDASGNRASQITGAAITSYTWDEENRLTGIAYPDATRATYVYSADSLRQRKIDSTGTVNYLWDESRLLQETDVSLVEIVRYTQGIEGWQTMSSQRRGGVDSFFAYDQIGNTRQLVDITGAVTDTTTYEAFGVERARTGSTTTNVQFGGQYNYIRDPASLSYALNRIVDSKTGQWLSRDLIGFAGGNWNLYGYVENDPVSGVDPTGLEANHTAPTFPPAVCYKCVQSIKDNWWASWQHNANHEYIHCLACCSLTLTAGAACAVGAQWGQNTFVQGSDKTKKTKEARMKFCEAGIAAAINGTYEDCHINCLKLYPFVIPKKKPTPQHPPTEADILWERQREISSGKIALPPAPDCINPCKPTPGALVPLAPPLPPLSA